MALFFKLAHLLTENRVFQTLRHQAAFHTEHALQYCFKIRGRGLFQKMVSCASISSAVFGIIPDGGRKNRQSCASAY